MTNTKLRVFKAMRALAVGAILLQAGGCDANGFLQLLQTTLLGITAAGSIAILRNV